VRVVNDSDDLMLATEGGKVIRIRVSGIPTRGRNTQGVRLIRLDEGERLVGIGRVESLEAADEGALAEAGPAAGAAPPTAES